MSRHRPSGSQGHKVRRHAHDDYELTWYVDRYYTGSRLRYPRRGRRWTDEAGARRFCKRWNIAFPEEST